ncbi:hypothetical protein EaACW_2132 [Erwinia amylovora ACW56400]|uniref:Uncharacterized protein n=2 Tax=Erwinia amylovora TaxID=552 RepID=A0A831A405_ERWAM|nr:hypothetical protein EaACW_2132 [Erwinia amylovora ACW56400]CBA21097.1 hypothetical protein predicted by Glimmer/Critica [Erwinia amylovora CFBP1430]CCO78978.1 hypothetical protein BN432_2185 [Erwinia amylovora Ea356]CCO82779.1 hypothetical protein BN433_2213 [Erwinia amylovora Ea266]CCO86554.1 hypothetical protein BN434_2171 [Erwinia amylovora CFBP 2585]CCO90343.1 hypothetical protein BN435_2177 [Erwinia amylovora 01SFR-BO]CCO94109.1 hypothetical protein BN437_2184 [Erwinia amylovora NBRC
MGYFIHRAPGIVRISSEVGGEDNQYFAINNSQFVLHIAFCLAEESRSGCSVTFPNQSE